MTLYCLKNGAISCSSSIFDRLSVGRRSHAEQIYYKSTTENPQQSTNCINIFISYASDDRELVASIEALLKDTFEFAPLNVHRDAEIKEGQNWVKQIDLALQEADILLVIFTERLKMSHSYTGYEIGYFNRSIQQRRKSSAGFDRIYIPFVLEPMCPTQCTTFKGCRLVQMNCIKF
jgi:TIR domain